MTKEEKIKEAYKAEFNNNEQDYDKRFESLKIWINIHGWLSGTLYDVDMNKFDVSGHEIRPKSLRGIENNNGWTNIYSIDDLPDMVGENIIFYRNGLTTTYPSEDVSEDKKTYLKYSHFKIRTKELNPIY